MSASIPPVTLSEGRSYQQRLRDCLGAFARAAGSPSTLAETVAGMAAESAAIVGAARATIWLLDRRAHQLWPASSSDGISDPGIRVAEGERASPAALGLTLERPARVGAPPATTIVAPLRGWRRALGTLVLDGAVSPDLTADQTLELAHDVARQLSAVIENAQLVEEVVRQHRLLRDSFNSLADLVLVTDNGLRAVQANDALARALGSEPERMFQTSLGTVVGEEIAAWVIGDGDPAPDPPPTSSARTRTFEGSPLGGTVVVTVTPLVGDDQDLLGRVIVARDVTQQAQLEAEREILRARLVQSEKLASLGQFVAGVAHEINNPLQGVLGYAELLLRSEKALPIRSELRRVLHEADRAAKIVRNLLVFSGSRRMVRRRLTVERALTRAMSSRRSALSRAGIEVIRRHPDEPRSVLGDPLLLQQAFLNLLINAEHAIIDTGRSGTIEITTETGSRGDTIVTRIRDTGGGIHGDVLPRIFDPFFTTKEVNKGTGLGLTIAYGIVQDHGGSIEAGNLPSGGAIFTIELPVAPDVPPPRARRRKAAAEDA